MANNLFNVYRNYSDCDMLKCIGVRHASYKLDHRIYRPIKVWFQTPAALLPRKER